MIQNDPCSNVPGLTVQSNTNLKMRESCCLCYYKLWPSCDKLYHVAILCYYDKHIKLQPSCDKLYHVAMAHATCACNYIIFSIHMFSVKVAELLGFIVSLLLPLLLFPMYVVVQSLYNVNGLRQCKLTAVMASIISITFNVSCC